MCNSNLDIENKYCIIIYYSIRISLSETAKLILAKYKKAFCILKYALKNSTIAYEKSWFGQNTIRVGNIQYTIEIYNKGIDEISSLIEIVILLTLNLYVPAEG